MVEDRKVDDAHRPFPKLTNDFIATELQEGFLSGVVAVGSLSGWVYTHERSMILLRF
jgi:hypothetical protein